MLTLQPADQVRAVARPHLAGLPGERGKLRELGLAPSDPCTDAEFARRSSLDICGVLPKPAEVVAFETDVDPDKRAKWVDRLLARPEYADLFAMKWSAILKNKRGLGQVSQPGTFAFHGWIRQSLAENKPYDKFVAEIVAARGDAEVNPQVVWYRQAKTIEERVDDSAQLFLGIRIQCARCHHHPFEKWSQDDYYGFASLFSRIGTKPGSDPTSPRIYTLPSGLASNPLTGEALKPNRWGHPSCPTSARSATPAPSWSSGSGSPITRSSPKPWSIATGSTSWAGAWSSPRTTCG